jgi:two-component system, sensor histidine kinase PdtaS
VTDMDMKIILLVEDDAIIALTEKMSLETYGYSVVTVSSGEKALKTMKERADIDLILMDIDLGTGIDGTEAAEHISTFAAKTPYLRRNYYLDK